MRPCAYRRYTPELSASLMRIFEALGGTVHFSNLIEGNQLPIVEAGVRLAANSPPTRERRSSSSTTWTRWALSIVASTRTLST